MISFTCPSCKAGLQAAENLVGKSVVCTACKKPATVPTAGLPKFLSSSDVRMPEAAPSAQQANSAKPASKMPLIILGIIGLCVIAGAIVMISGPSEPGPVVIIETSMGTIKAELNQDRAPISVENFLAYVDKKHYDGTIFHRVISDFMIQGGGYDVNMSEKPTNPPIRNEGGNGLRNERGTLAMARTGQPDSATSQFFINVVDNKFLDRANSPDKVGYAVFGKVIEGMDVVDRIRRVKKKEGTDFPAQEVIIKSIRRADTKK